MSDYKRSFVIIHDLRMLMNDDEYNTPFKKSADFLKGVCPLTVEQSAASLDVTAHIPTWHPAAPSLLCLLDE